MRQRESPGRKGVGMPDEFLGEQGDKQLSVKPGMGAVFIVFRQVAELGNLLEAFEHQLDLPAKPVMFENLFQRKIFFGEVVKNMTYCA